MSKVSEALKLKWARTKQIDEILGEGITSMFVRRGLPDDYANTGNLIEQILLQNACGAYVYRDDLIEKRWIFGAAQTCGQPNSYGFGKDVIVTAGGGFVKKYEDWETNPDIVVAWNNPIMAPDYVIGLTADMLTECLTSLRCQIINTRHHPLPAVVDDKMKQAVDTAIKDMEAGVNRTIVSTNLIKNLLDIGIDRPAVDMIAISDPELSNNLQYTSKQIDDILRWFWNIYGHNAQASSKLAQQSVEEVTTGASISMIIPHARYHQRQREAELLKERFGWDVTIEFSEPWQNAFARCEKELNEEVTEDDPDQLRLSDPDDVEEVPGGSDEDRGSTDDV